MQVDHEARRMVYACWDMQLIRTLQAPETQRACGVYAARRGSGAIENAATKQHGDRNRHAQYVAPPHESHWHRPITTIAARCGHAGQYR